MHRKIFIGEKVAVAGLLKTRCGLQRGAQLMLRKMKEDGIFTLPVCLSDKLGHALNVEQQSECSFQPEDLDYMHPSDIIIHLNPPVFTLALSLFSKEVLRNSSMVGYWAWEINKISDEWRVAAELCDEIWVPSKFVEDTLCRELAGFNGLIKVRPHPVDVDPIEKTTEAQRECARLDFKIPMEYFVVGTSFSFDSNYSRKNPVGSIKAFKKAFVNGEKDVQFLLRCHDGSKHPELLNDLKIHIGGDKRIRIIDNAKTGSIGFFYQVIDLYISLHRSEGYGLTLSEAAQSGIPVLATSWGLAEDIARRGEVIPVDYELIAVEDLQHFYTKFPGASWADPKISQAVEQMQSLYQAFRARRSSNMSDASF